MGGHLADLKLAQKILEEVGPQGLPAKLSKSLGSGLFEFRLSGFETKERIFYCYLIGKRVVFLHVFTKTTQKTPPKELKLAQNRHAELLLVEAREKMVRKGAKNAGSQ